MTVRNVVARAFQTYFGYSRSNFDGHGYLMANPDVAAKGKDPWLHYVRHGKTEGRRFVNKSDIGIVNAYTKFLSSGYFDPEWYMTTYPDVRSSGKNPLQHFCENGVWEGRDPGPNFSTSWYLEQNPDIGGMNPLEHFIDHGRKEGRSPKPPKGSLQAAADTFNSILDLDPELCGCEDFYFFKSVQFVDGRKRDSRLKPVLRALMDAIPAETKRLLFVPWLRHSGADLVAANVARAASEENGVLDLVVIVADYDVTEAHSWLPEGVTVLSIPRICPDLTLKERAELIEVLLRLVRPKKILNINSQACWLALRQFGHLIKYYTEIYAYLFCHDYTARGASAGYADIYFRETIGFLYRVYFDNNTFINELSEQYCLTETDRKKLAVVKQPIESRDYHKTQSERFSGELSILWASRIARQKNWAVLLEIVSLAPRDVHFHVWGDGDEQDVEQLRSRLSGRKNVTLHGAYSSFHELPLVDYDVFLYTSRWDGIPNVILEAASYGFPIIAPKVGGIPEVIGDDNGWLVEPNAPAYVNAISSIKQDLKAASRKAMQLKAFVRQEHTWERYKSTIAADDQFLS